MDEFLTFIEEDFIRCVRCSDHGVINAMAQHPCPVCRSEDYKEWKQAYDEDRKIAKEKKR